MSPAVRGHWGKLYNADFPCIVLKINLRFSKLNSTLLMYILRPILWNRTGNRSMANRFPPRVNVNRSVVEIGRQLRLQDMFEFSDLDGNPLRRVRFRDNIRTADSGYFRVAGIRQPSATWIEVPASQLDTVFYKSGLRVNSESISVQGSSFPKPLSVLTMGLFVPNSSQVVGSRSKKSFAVVI